MKVYLCGPINGCTDAEANDWREAVKVHFPDAINPMRRDYRGEEDESVNEITDLDELDLRRCDVVVRNYTKPSDGSSFEQCIARRELGIPVVVWAAPGANISPWVRRYATCIVYSLEALIAKLKEIAA